MVSYQTAKKLIFLVLCQEDEEIENGVMGCLRPRKNNVK